MGMVEKAPPPHTRPLFPREGPCTDCIGGSVGPRAGQDGLEILSPTGIRSPDLPFRSQLLCRLSYPGPQYSSMVSFNIYGTNNMLMHVVKGGKLFRLSVHFSALIMLSFRKIDSPCVFLIV